MTPKTTPKSPQNRPAYAKPCYLNPMRLIRGAPGTGKTALIFDAFAQAVRNGETALRIIVPTATLVRHYQHELARTGLVFDPNAIMTLSRFARECVPNLTLVPARLVRALNPRLSLSPATPRIRPGRRKAGMADIVIETIARFENAGCTPDRLLKDRKLTPLGKAFQRVWKEVGRRHRGTQLRHPRPNHPPGRHPSVPQGKIWIDGFLRFSPLESDFLRAIAATSDVTLTLTDGPITFDAYRFAMELGAHDRLLPGTPPPSPNDSRAGT